MATAEIYQTPQIRELETLAEQRFGMSSESLMQRAGEAALQYCLTYWSSVKQVAVICGPGNNGGDGYVFALKALKKGLTVIVRQVGDDNKRSAVANAAYQACKAARIDIKPFQIAENLQYYDVIVDAIFGIGLQRELDNQVKAIIEAINQSKRPVLALDIPSGVNADTGAIMGVAVNAAATITFIGNKLGLFTGAGTSYCGTVCCDDLGLPAELFSLVAAPVEKISLKAYSSYLKPRPRDFDKGKAGHVVIVGGDEGFSGAPLMAAVAALRVGAGLVTIATHPKHASFLNIAHPEIMCQGIISPIAMKKLLKKATVVVVGPGLGESVWSRMLLKAVLRTELPLIVDADGLNLLADKSHHRENWILTPHPGEAGRLLKTPTRDIQLDRYTAIKHIQQQYHGVVVLKGSGSLIANESGAVALCDAGNPGMSSAGMGDILSGVLGGLAGQHIPLAITAKLGAFIHASAGDLAATTDGERGLIATDLLPFLRHAVNVGGRQ